jgi:(p)ppGpp synthase/HD superfamily hydrolase
MAEQLHSSQTRKNGTPYINHLYAVADIISQYTDDEDIICAGLLHDTIEDVDGYEYENLLNDFGKRVADIVEGVTEEVYVAHPEYSHEQKIEQFEGMLTRTVKKAKDAGADSLLVMAADKIHNIQSMIQGVKDNGQEYLLKFKMPMSQKIKYYRMSLDAVKENDKYGISDYFERVLDEGEKILLK